jgi:prolyl-tRNA synthetase
MTKPQTAITPTREENYPEWYQEVIKQADLAEHSPVRGCMVIKPFGFAIWENIQKILDKRFKKTGVKNAYFPLFIPLSFLEKEAGHVEGFAKECAVVTHHRLEKGPDGKLIPSGELEEPLIVRPTSETIIGDAFSKWVTSYRDLPLLINQWCNVVRWEMRTRLFLRTAEFLWQEGHTVHASDQEAQEKALQMLYIYEEFVKNYLAIPVIVGEKTPHERFPGAKATYTLEMMMQDGKALQGGTSHHLGQNFAKASEIKFQTEEGQVEYAHTTSWGLTTRLIGAMIMTHGDDDGMVLPPKIASMHIVIIPILNGKGRDEEVLEKAKELKTRLEQTLYHGQELEVYLDDREKRGGDKSWEWIKKGVPVRIEIGPKDIDEGKVCVMQRTRPHKDKEFMSMDEFLNRVVDLLDSIQFTLYEKAKARLDAHIFTVNSKEEFYAFFNDPQKRGFIKGFFSGEPWIEEEIKKDLNVTIRCRPLTDHQTSGTCVFTGKKTDQSVIYAKAY